MPSPRSGAARTSRHATMLLLSLVCLTLPASLAAYSSGPGGAGLDATGSPYAGGATCAQCHGGADGTTKATLSVRDSGGMTPTQLVGGQTYEVELRVTSPVNSLFGAQLTVFDSDTDDPAGIFGATALTPQTQISDILGRQYLENAGRSSSGVFRGQWTAPVADYDEVTFYFVGLAVNGSGTRGDRTSNAGTFTLPVLLPCRDTDSDGLCDDGEDDDDDNDGVKDGQDSDPRNPKVCRDTDGDGCDDCARGKDGFGPASDALPNDDGPDADRDGVCDLGDQCIGDDASGDDDDDGVCNDYTGPLVSDDEVVLLFGASLVELDVLANDRAQDDPLDPSSLTLTRELTPDYAGALLLDRQTGRVTFSPAPRFIGRAEFGYVIEDTEGRPSRETRVTLIVNDRPVPGALDPVILEANGERYIPWEQLLGSSSFGQLNGGGWDTGASLLSLSADEGFAASVTGAKASCAASSEGVTINARGELGMQSCFWSMCEMIPGPVGMLDLEGRACAVGELKIILVPASGGPDPGEDMDLPQEEDMGSLSDMGMGADMGTMTPGSGEEMGAAPGPVMGADPEEGCAVASVDRSGAPRASLAFLLAMSLCWGVRLRRRARR